jgi:hypothetical protein
MVVTWMLDTMWTARNDVALQTMAASAVPLPTTGKIGRFGLLTCFGDSGTPRRNHADTTSTGQQSISMRIVRALFQRAGRVGETS